jgi:hypothetical protein
MRNLVASIGSILTPIAASAHPGHAGSTGVGLVHYVSDPLHIATGVLGIGAVLLIAVVWRVQRRHAGLAHLPRATSGSRSSA